MTKHTRFTAIIIALIFAALSLSACSAPQATATPASTLAPTPSPSPTPIPTPTPDQGQFGGKFLEYFSASGLLAGDGFYTSEDINASISTEHNDELDVTYYVVDIYIRNIDNLKTAFSQDKYGSKGTKTIDQALNHNAVCAVNGDYYNFDDDGIVIRNGEIYREKISKEDVCVIYKDGTMATYSPEDVDIEAIKAAEPWQAWSFGPMLLDADGQPMSEFNSGVQRANPRTAIGYIEPGHYLFVVVDGRSSASKGIKMADFSQLMHDLGCVQAYNLDGGKTSVMTFGTGVANKPYEGGRICSDILYIAEKDDAPSWGLVTIPTNTASPIATMTATPKPTTTATATLKPSQQPTASVKPSKTPKPVVSDQPVGTEKPTKAPATEPPTTKAPATEPPEADEAAQ